MEVAALGIVLPGFVLGLTSGLHCVGMCGGVVAAFSSQKGIVRIVRDKATVRERPRAGLLALFNLGRVAAYTLAGAIAGAVGGAGAYAAGAVDFQVGLFVLSNVMLLFVGVYLAGLSPALAISSSSSADVRSTL